MGTKQVVLIEVDEPTVVAVSTCPRPVGPASLQLLPDIVIALPIVRARPRSTSVRETIEILEGLEELDLEEIDAIVEEEAPDPADPPAMIAIADPLASIEIDAEILDPIEFPASVDEQAPHRTRRGWGQRALAAAIVAGSISIESWGAIGAALADFQRHVAAIFDGILLLL